MLFAKPSKFIIWSTMKLKTKILGVLLLVLVLYGVFSYGIQRLVVFPSYLKQERIEAEKDLNRCLEALKREIHHLDSFTHDWAAWDDSYEFVVDRNDEYIDSNLLSNTFIDNNLNIILFLDLEGLFIWGEIWDLETKTKLKVPEIFSNSFSSDHPFLRHTEDAESSVAGVYLTNKGPLLVASRQILRSSHMGPTRGYLIMGRFLNGNYTRTLVEQTKVDHRFWQVDSVSIPENGQSALNRLKQVNEIVFTKKNENFLYAYGIFQGINGEPALLVRAEVPRDIWKNSKETLFSVSILTMVEGIALLVIMFLLLRNMVVNPIDALTGRVASFSNSNQPPPAMFLERKDEIGILCREFDRLFKKLSKYHNSLEKTNERLRHEIIERKKSEQELGSKRVKLLQLAYELLMTEERERRRLAADLHDHIGQNLALCQLKLAILSESKTSSDMVDELGKIEEMLERIIQDTRILTFEISPPVLYELGLKAALEWLAEKTESTCGTKVRVEEKFSEKVLGNSLNILIFRTVRELLHNVAKHSQASEAVIRLEPGEEAYAVVVKDNGIGFDADSEQHTQNRGFGLFNIQERFSSIAGEFNIKSEPGFGTEAVLKVPYNWRADEN